MTSPSLTPAIRDALRASLPEMEVARDEIAAIVADATERLRIAEQRIAAIRLLIDEEDDPVPSDSGSHELTWSDFIFQELRGLDGGLTHQQLIGRMVGTPLEARFAKSPNGFYARVSKLEGAGKLIRDGKVIFLPDTYQRLRMAGGRSITLPFVGGKSM